MARPKKYINGKLTDGTEYRFETGKFYMLRLCVEGQEYVTSPMECAGEREKEPFFYRAEEDDDLPLGHVDIVAVL